MKESEVKDILLQNGISPSLHRLKIYAYLIHHKTHPTADNIYQELQEEIPTLSRTTVYNTLKFLCRKNLVHALAIDENETRYDADVKLHGHFKCATCGMLYDVPVAGLLKSTIRQIDGHTVTEQQLYLKGICKNCAE